jgi:hypothetical protein
MSAPPKPPLKKPFAPPLTAPTAVSLRILPQLLAFSAKKLTVDLVALKIAEPTEDTAPTSELTPELIARPTERQALPTELQKPILLLL